jgi:hypothetical protein
MPNVAKQYFKIVPTVGIEREKIQIFQVFMAMNMKMIVLRCFTV